MEDKENLIHLTKRLLNDLQELTKKLADVKSSGVRGDFYLEVKPCADKMKLNCDQWSEKAATWINIHKPTNIYLQQIESACEHLETMSVQAFYPDTSKSRFNNMVASSNYVLHTLLQEIEKEKDPLGL